MPPDPAEPAGEHPAEQRAEGRGGDEQSGGPGVAPVPEDGDGREEGAGWARTIAHRSVKKVIRRLGRVPRKRSPSRTEARLPVSLFCRSGSIEGSRHMAYSEAVKQTASTVYAAR